MPFWRAESGGTGLIRLSNGFNVPHDAKSATVLKHLGRLGVVKSWWERMDGVAWPLGIEDSS